MGARESLVRSMARHRWESGAKSYCYYHIDDNSTTLMISEPYVPYNE